MLWMIGIAYIVLCFVLQTVLLRKTKKRILHFLPLFLIGIVYLAAICLPVLDGMMIEQGRNDGYMFYGFVGLITAGINTLGLISIGAAWLIQKV